MYPSGFSKYAAIGFLLASLSGCSGGDSDVAFGSDNTQSFSLGTGIQYSSNAIHIGKTAIGDLNGDGLNDVVTMESGGFGQRLLFYYQNSAHTFDPAVVTTLSDTYIRSLALGDVNGDGASDVIVSGLSISALSGYLGRIVLLYQDPLSGTLQFPATEKVVSSNTVGSVVVADLNADGKQDIAVLGSWEQSALMGNIALFYQQGDGSLSAEALYADSPVLFTGELHAADMDNDGDKDLIFQSDLLQLAVLKQDSSQVPSLISGLPDYYPVQTSSWPSFSAFSVGDLNKDGRTDIAVHDPSNGGLLNIFYQNTLGALDGPSLSSPFDATYGIEIADIDEDGVNEILSDVVTSTLSPDTGGLVLVSPQSGTVPYSETTGYVFGTVSGGGSPIHDALSVGDVTGDGHKDAVVSWADEGLYVLPAVFQ